MLLEPAPVVPTKNSKCAAVLPGFHVKVTLVFVSGVGVFGAGVVSAACVIDDVESNGALAVIVKAGEIAAGVICREAFSEVSSPALSCTLLKVAPVPATVVTGPRPVTVNDASVSVMGTAPMFWPFSVTETMGAGLGVAPVDAV